MDSDDLIKVYVAVLSGQPDPIGTPESEEAYEDIKKEVEANPDAIWEIPNE